MSSRTAIFAAFILVLFFIAIFFIQSYREISLKNQGTIGGISQVTQQSVSPLPTPRVSVAYVDITSKASDGRDSVQLLTPIKPDYIFRAYWKWGDLPDSKHQSYKQKISDLKNAIPGVYVGGFLPLQCIQRAPFSRTTDRWTNGSTISTTDFNSMILYGNDSQPLSHYDCYVPDPRSTLFQDFIVGWAKKENEAGVDIIHYDGDGIALGMAYAHGTITDLHAFDDSFKTIFERTRNEAGVLVTSNNMGIGNTRGIPYGFYSVEPHLDFIDGQVWNKTLDKPFVLHENYTASREHMMIVYGKEIPLNLFMDYAAGTSDSALAKFVSLSLDDKKTILKMIDDDAKAHGASFIYPIHGGSYVNPTNPLDRGTYDSVKFGIYDTIVELANSPPPTTSTTTIFITTTTSTITSTTGSILSSTTTTIPSSTTLQTTTTWTSTTRIITTTVFSQTTTQPSTTISHITSCPYECCISQPNYLNKLCKEGFTCINNKCMKLEEHINYSLLVVVIVLVAILFVLLYFLHGKSVSKHLL